jgi:hypothetical protein
MVGSAAYLRERSFYFTNADSYFEASPHIEIERRALFMINKTVS